MAYPETRGSAGLKCRSCGHSLTVLEAVRCSECGLAHQVCLQTSRDRVPARRFALLLVLIALLQAAGFAALGVRQNQQLEYSFKIADNKLTLLKAYAELRKALVDSPSAPRSVIDAQDKAVTAARAAEKSARVETGDGTACFIISVGSLLAVLIAVSLFGLAWIRRFGEVSAKERRLRWTLVAVWVLLISGSWGLLYLQIIALAMMH